MGRYFVKKSFSKKHVLKLGKMDVFVLTTKICEKESSSSLSEKISKKYFFTKMGAWDREGEHFFS